MSVHEVATSHGGVERYFQNVFLDIIVARRGDYR